jgi:membrane-bound lytic murein transglycosylase A
LRKFLVTAILLSFCSPVFAANKIDKKNSKHIVSKVKLDNVKKDSLGNVEKLALDDSALAAIFKTDVRQDVNFLTALDRSIEYFAYIQDRETEFKYGTEIYSAKEMLNSLLLFKDIALQDASYDEFLGEISRLFDIYTINNYKSQSIFTGYFTPKLQACLTQIDEYRTPLYLKDGTKIFVRTNNEAKSVAMEGASILQLETGETKVITYAKTEFVYTQIKEQKVLRKVAKNQAKVIYTTKTIKTPRTLFEETAEPMGSIATPLTPGYSAAMDRRFTPMGSLIYVYNEKENGDAPFDRFMLVQDVGGAIKGPGRIDVYLGEGNKAEQDTFNLARKGSVLMLVAKKEVLDNTKLVSLILPRGNNE